VSRDLNNLLLKFVLSKFDRLYITFDLDAEKDVVGNLERLGLCEDRDFKAVGLQHQGKKSIEGLLPNRILSLVNARETNLLMELTSPGCDRKGVKNQLKKKYLEEFVKHDDYTPEELKEFIKLVKIINKAFEGVA